MKFYICCQLPYPYKHDKSSFFKSVSRKIKISTFTSPYKMHEFKALFMMLNKSMSCIRSLNRKTFYFKLEFSNLVAK